MKHKFIKFLFVFSLLNHVGYSQWYKERFVIGSFADPRIFGVTRANDVVKDSISFALAQGAYINLLSGPQFYNGAQDFSLMDKTLDLASKHDMHVMVIDSKLQVTASNFSDSDAQRILLHFKNIDAKKREAVGGYSFGGEFPLNQASKIKKWAGFFNNNDVNRPAYTYLLPCYGFNSRAAYEEYLDDYLTEADSKHKLQIVAYDYYPFLTPALMTSYFYNLGIIKEKAANRPIWYFIQSTTKKGLPDINDYQLKFMTYCPLAYGAKGALYYTYESVPTKLGLNYYDAIIDLNGKPTAKYYKIRAINYYITNFAGPIVMKNICVGTYHVSQGATNENIPDKYILPGDNKYVKNISNKNILLGIFKSEQPVRYYLMLINKSSNVISDIKISVPGKKSIVEYPGSENYHGSKTKTKLPTNIDNKNATNFSVDRIAGGEMTIIEVS